MCIYSKAYWIHIKYIRITRTKACHTNCTHSTTISDDVPLYKKKYKHSTQARILKKKKASAPRTHARTRTHPPSKTKKYTTQSTNKKASTPRTHTPAHAHTLRHRPLSPARPPSLTAVSLLPHGRGVTQAWGGMCRAKRKRRIGGEKRWRSSMHTAAQSVWTGALIEP